MGPVSLSVLAVASLPALGPSPLAVVRAVNLAVDEDKVTPGALGFLVVVVLGIATWLLVRSMNKQMKKVDFEERTAGDPGAAPRSDDDPDRR
jgi:hypothetical protein